MKTGAEFVESLRGLQHQLYLLGEQVDEAIEHPILRPSLNALARTYDMVQDPNHADLFVRQGLDGKHINCFTSLHQNRQDLLDKVKALRILGQETGTCFQRCVGWDALNALESTTFEAGTKHWSSLTMSLSRVSGSFWMANGSSPAPWWSALPATTGRVTVAARWAWVTC